VYSEQARASASKPTVYFAMNSRSIRFSAIISRIMPKARAMSVPGRIGRCQSACLAVRLRWGSITTNVAPRARACLRKGMTWRLVDTALLPHIRISLAWGISSMSEERWSPVV
jgi:cytochrome b